MVGADVRMPSSISELRIGLKCGGSDGFSGITANPLVGLLSDYITTWEELLEQLKELVIAIFNDGVTL